MARGYTPLELLLSLCAAGLLVAGIAAMTRARPLQGSLLVVAAMLVGPAAVALLS